MHSVELLDSLTELAEQLGFQIRYEWLGGGGGGGGTCQYHGKTWLFLDLAADPADRLDSVVTAVAADERWKDKQLAPDLRELLQSRTGNTASRSG